MPRLRAYLIIDPLIVLATIVLGFLSMLAAFLDRSGNASHRIARLYGRVVTLVSGMRVRVEGLQNIPRRGGCVVAANHLSFTDTPLLLAHIPLQFRFLAKSSLLRVPFIGGHLRRAGHVAIPLEDVRGSLKAMTDAARMVKEQGLSVLIFPEGGRSDGRLQEFKEGAAYIAIKAGVPLVPVAIQGTREVLPRGSLVVRPGKVLLRIGAPIPTADLTLQDRADLTARLRATIVELMGECK